MTTGHPTRRQNVHAARSSKGRILDLLRQAEGPVSGQWLSHRLGVTRVAVWKQIRALQDAGYEIAAGPKGYRLTHSPDAIFPWEFPGREARVHYHAETDSTMSLARDLARGGCPAHSVIVTDRQTKGRGRLDRQWLSPPGGLYFTMVLRPEVPPMAALKLNFAASLEMVRCLNRRYDVPARVKWPNDILVGHRKICGMLAEMEAETDRVTFINIGMGINVNNPPDSRAPQAVSLGELVGRPVRRSHLLSEFLDAFETRCSGDLTSVINEWKHLSATIGSRVRVQTAKGTTSGQAEDIDDDGALMVRDDDGTLNRVLYGDCFHINGNQ